MPAGSGTPRTPGRGTSRRTASIASGKRPPSYVSGPIASRTRSISSSSTVPNSVRRHRAAVVEGGAVFDPLPDLGARDLRRRGVLHQIVERHRAAAAQPGLDILHADADVLAQALLGARALMHLEQLVAADRDVLAHLLELVGAGMSRSNTSCATGTRSGCATQVPSWPSLASRCLSARTLAKAASFAAGSFLPGSTPPCRPWRRRRACGRS